MIRVIELFSGVGAQRMALRNIGVNHISIGVCEIDSAAHKSYEAIHGLTPNFGDITKVETLPSADLWTYSFPCTDLSVAGKQAGLTRGSGTRSGLLWEVERLLNGSEKPKYLLMENVKQLVGKKFKKDFDEWCNILEQMGYKNHWKVLNAKDFGVPQNRERVFMVSILDGEDFSFPKPVELNKRLKDVLEDSVSSKFDITNKNIKPSNNTEPNCLTERRSDEARELRRKIRKETGKDFSPRRGKDIVPRTDGISNCLTTSPTIEQVIVVPYDKDKGEYNDKND